MSTGEIIGAQHNLIRAALRCLTADHLRDDTADADAEVEYAYEQLALAARDLTYTVNAAPSDRQPVGWSASGGSR